MNRLLAIILSPLIVIGASQHAAAQLPIDYGFHRYADVTGTPAVTTTVPEADCFQWLTGPSTFRLEWAQGDKGRYTNVWIESPVITTQFTVMHQITFARDTESSPNRIVWIDRLDGYSAISSHFGNPITTNATLNSTDLSVFFNGCRATLPMNWELFNYPPGDSNLDGVFNSSDLVSVFTSGLYATGQLANWRDGDWNGDRAFTTDDFVYAFSRGSYSRDAVQPMYVPEPESVFLALIGLVSAIHSRRW